MVRVNIVVNSMCTQQGVLLSQFELLLNELNVLFCVNVVFSVHKVIMYNASTLLIVNYCSEKKSKC